MAAGLAEKVESSWIGRAIVCCWLYPRLPAGPLIGYFAVVGLAKYCRGRSQAPLLAMFSVTFLGSIISSLVTFAVLSLSGVLLPLSDVLGVLTLPGVLLNMLLAIPVYAVMRDLARWVYPSPEVE